MPRLIITDCDNFGKHGLPHDLNFIYAIPIIGDSSFKNKMIVREQNMLYVKFMVGERKKQIFRLKSHFINKCLTFQKNSSLYYYDDLVKFGEIRHKKRDDSWRSMYLAEYFVFNIYDKEANVVFLTIETFPVQNTL